MMQKIMVVCVIVAVVTLCNHRIMAQDVGLSYLSELQTDFRTKVKWVNLLRADVSVALNKNIGVEAASISVAGTSETPLLNDWQGFSSVEAENIPLALAVLGVRWQVGKSAVFVGIRNLNEDYFTSSCISLFTNSFCGIFPTLSADYPIANYPVASVGVDYKWQGEYWGVEASVYNGTGYRMFAGRENVFRFCPGSDGILGISTVNYQNNGSGYYMGFALRNGLSACYAEGTEETEEKKGWNAVVWGYAEQKVFDHWYLLVQYSVNPTAKTGCRSYAGGGLVAHYGRLEAGMFADYADYTTGHEWASELTCKMCCLKNMYIQPALHLIKNSRMFAWAGLFRFGYEI